LTKIWMMAASGTAVSALVGLLTTLGFALSFALATLE
jgi:hypothetical protein